MELGLKGKRAIVTGGTRGIGAAIVRQLAEEGVTVVTCARNAAEVNALNTDAQAAGLPISASVCDVADKPAYEAWLAGAVSALGGVDIFVPNVSGGAHQGEEAWQIAHDVDLMATIRGCDAVIAPMAQGGGGSIVVIASISGVEAFGGPTAYGTTKAALIAYASQLADVAMAHGIRVNSVSPGPIHVDDGFWGTVQRDQPDMYEEVRTRHGAGRLGTTAEVANCVVFLASDAASWVSGTNIVVDGAVTKRVQF